MKEITLKVYDYSELKGKSKDRAISKIMDIFSYDFYEIEGDYIQYELIPMELSNRGISIKYMNAHWECGFQQGDYIYLEGDLELNKKILLNIGMNENESNLILDVLSEIEIGKSISFCDNYLKWEGFPDEIDFEIEDKFEDKLNNFLYDLYYDLMGKIEDVYLEIGSENYIESFLEDNEDIVFMENGELIQI